MAAAVVTAQVRVVVWPLSASVAVIVTGVEAASSLRFSVVDAPCAITGAAFAPTAPRQAELVMVDNAGVGVPASVAVTRTRMYFPESAAVRV